MRKCGDLQNQCSDLPEATGRAAQDALST